MGKKKARRERERVSTQAELAEERRRWEAAQEGRRVLVDADKADVRDEPKPEPPKETVGTIRAGLKRTRVLAAVPSMAELVYGGAA